jgi:serine/threonine-protein kinase
MSSHDVPSTGLIAGKYELVGLIGRGGMGSVWEGRHATLGTRVAIKFIEKEYADSQEARNRFDNEARAAATIQSKHAIQIFDHGVTHDGKPYIVMELLQGEALDKRIERLGRLSLQDTARILQQVCRGLGRAHERGIVHRDLKPENIYLVRGPDDEEEIAKVLDFGIAKIKKTDEHGGISSSTKTGAVLGTPFYMSPEQARGLRNVDHRTDVWSLGVIAFKCVTGRLPFEGESIGDLLVKICTSPIPVPSSFVPGLPASFDAWFARALERDPERRFSTVTELADALAYAAGVSVRRGPGSSVSSGDTAYGRTVQAPASALGGATPPGPYGVSPSHGSGAAHAPAMHPPVHGPPGMGVTSAPLTSSTGLPRMSRSPLVASIIIGILALVAGIVLVTIFVRRSRIGADVTAKDQGSSSSALGASAPPSAASTKAPIAPADPAPTTTAADPAGTLAANASPTAAATTVATTKPTATGRPGATTRPTATTKPTATVVATTTATARPTATVVATPTATAAATTKPTATGKDLGPGY